MKIGIVITTYNKIDDAKINMEIIRSIWKESNYFSDIKIVHAFNGDKKWYKNKYLEDSLVTARNAGHYQGASELIDVGVNELKSKKWGLDYIVFLTADFWLIKPILIKNIIDDMSTKDLHLATNWWGGIKPDKPGNPLKAMATDMFIVDYKWLINSSMFPLNFEDFKNKYEDLFYSEGKQVLLERLLLSRFIKSIHDFYKNDDNLNSLVRSRIREIHERNNIFDYNETENTWTRRMVWLEAGIITSHTAKEKQEILSKLDLKVGLLYEQFITSTDLSYYNSLKS